MPKLSSPVGRSLNIDILKTLAIIAVPAIHFFYYNGFYKQPVVGDNMTALVFIRHAMLFSVPIFLLATGYLMHRKQLSARYYTGLIKVFYVYILTSLIYLTFNHFVMHGTAASDLKSVIKSIVTLNGSPYAWYIEMYIGLFLIIPFLNLIYHGLKSQKQKIILCLTLIVLTVLPTFKISDFSLPTYWVALWPITYYFIGAYISEFNFKLHKRHKFALLLIATIISSLIALNSISPETHLIASDQLHTGQLWQQVFIVIYSTLLFSLILDFRFDKVSAWKQKLITKISQTTLGIYLISALFDQLFYTKIYHTRDDFFGTLPMFFILVPLIIICSYVSSRLIDLSYQALRIYEKPKPPTSS